MWVASVRVEHPHTYYSFLFCLFLHTVITILMGRDVKMSAEKHGSNVECVLVRFAVQTEVSVVVYFD